MNIFRYDGTQNGFFTVVFEIYTKKLLPETITSSEDIQLALDGCIFEISTDEEKSDRIKNGIIKHIGKEGLRSFKYAFASCDNEKEMKMFSYIRLIFKHGNNVLHMLSLPGVIEYNLLVARVKTEIEHIKGFMRFSQLSSGVFLGEYTPDNDITDLLMPFFVERHSDMDFIIFDKNRNKMGMYNKQEFTLICCDQKIPEIFTEEEACFQSLWQQYFETVSISSRKNKRLQDRFLPNRYRRNMTEFSSKR